MNPHQNKLLLQIWRAAAIPAPQAEFRFHPERKWRFDFAWPRRIQTITDTDGAAAATVYFPKKHFPGGVAVEIQGGCWARGRHTRGAALVKEREKLNHAAALGWRVLFCSPQEAFTKGFADLLKQALKGKAEG